ncbi:MAG: delta-60 repeat domain-containing protein, partial [Acidimicrobiaceae bacterium]|nr:delta-60 repeat domain-containing protein [Acidimicrobiaceae bacterium]
MSSLSPKTARVTARKSANFITGQAIPAGFDDQDELYAAALQGDGKVVVVGQAVTNDHHDIILGRYNVDGSLDTSCGTDGS